MIFLAINNPHFDQGFQPRLMMVNPHELSFQMKLPQTSDNQWPFQEPIYWRYLPYIRPKAYEISRNIPRKYAQKYGTNVITSILGS